MKVIEKDKKARKMMEDSHLSHGSGHADQSQVAESTHKTGHHNVSGRDVRKSQESCTVPVTVQPVDTLPRARG